MKIALPSIAFALLSFCAASASPLAVFNFDNAADRYKASISAECCVTLTDIYPCCMTQSFYSSGGFNNTPYIGLSGWDKTQFDPAVYSQRDALYQFPHTLAFDISVNDGRTIANPTLSLDWQRTSTASPTFLQATVFWQDTAGIIQNWSSGPISLPGTDTWNSLAFTFVNGTAPFPTPVETSGETFHVELYAWGGDNVGDGILKLDNISVNGDCAPIPEPGSAILFAAAGFAMLIRRRSRR